MPPHKNLKCPDVRKYILAAACNVTKRDTCCVYICFLLCHILFVAIRFVFRENFTYQSAF